MAGVLHHVGSDLCYWLVTGSGQVVSKMLVEHVTHNDYLHEETRKRIKKFNEKLEECLDNTNFILATGREWHRFEILGEPC